VGNSNLVRDNPKQLIDKAYSDLRKIVTTAVVSRLGRLWVWEGDGAMGVFMFDYYTRMAIFAAMNILGEVFLYNRTDNPLKSDINLRISVHSGDLVYTKNETKVSKSDVVKTAIMLESKAAIPNSLVISDTLARSQYQSLLDVFSDVKSLPNSAGKYRMYYVSQGKN